MSVRLVLPNLTKGKWGEVFLRLVLSLLDPGEVGRGVCEAGVCRPYLTMGMWGEVSVRLMLFSPDHG